MQIQGKRIFVTGGAGFIGSRLIERLIEENEIVVYDNLARNALKDLPCYQHPNLEIIKGDILDYGHLKESIPMETDKVSFKPRYIYLKFALVRYFLYNLIDKFMSFCRFQTDEIINYWRIPRNKIFCNYLGIDTETFRPINEEMKSSLRSEFSLEPDTPILGVVSRLYPVKGVHKAIEILPQIKKEIPNVKLFIVGDGPLRTVYERMVREKGLEDSVTFTGERHDIPKLMNLFDLYLQTTDFPLLGVSALEALATAKPIATFVRNEKEERMAQETVIEGVNGIILRIGSPEDVRKLIALLKDREKLKNMGYASRKLAEEKFNFTSHIKNLEKLLRKLAGGAN